MDRRDIPKALLAAATGAVLVSQRAQAQTCTPPCYPTVPAETIAGVTPLNPAYPPGHLLRYLSSFTSNVTNCTTGLQDLLKVLRVTGGRGRLPAGVIRYASTLAMDTTSITLKARARWKPCY